MTCQSLPSIGIRISDMSWHDSCQSPIGMIENLAGIAQGNMLLSLCSSSFIDPGSLMLINAPEYI